MGHFVDYNGGMGRGNPMRGSIIRRPAALVAGLGRKRLEESRTTFVNFGQGNRLCNLNKEEESESETFR